MTLTSALRRGIPKRTVFALSALHGVPVQNGRL